MAPAVDAGFVTGQMIFIQPLFGFPPSVTNGGAVVSQTLSLPRDGVLTSLPVQLRVVRADWFRAKDVAQVRDGGSVSTGKRLAVVDFGTARTVAAVALSPSDGSSPLTGPSIASVKRWLGAAFDKDALETQPGLIGGATTFASEVRTERLLVECTASSFAAVLDALAVQLPEIPSDLELRIDGGAPVWTSAGAVTAGALPDGTPPLRLAATGTANGTQRWRSVPATGSSSPAAFVQELDLAAPLNALIGNPDAPHGELREVTLSLSSRIPGSIVLTVPTSLTPHLRHVVRATDGFVEGRRDVTFTSEGLQALPLALPAWASEVHSASLTISGSCDGNRTIPPTGMEGSILPGDAGDGGVLPVAELVLDGERALALFVNDTQGLLTLSGVRVPLIPDVGGCEVRAILLAHDPVQFAPSTAIDGGTGKSVSVDATVAGVEQWVTLPLQSPYTLKAGEQLHVALHVVRGAATMAVRSEAAFTPPPPAPDGTPSVDVRAESFALPFRGPPAGPWELIPASPDLAAFRGRLRLTGTAPNDRPIAPVRAALSRPPGSGDGVTPGPKGVPVQLAAPVSLASLVPSLQLVALTPCTLTVRDVVLTVTARV